jgi:hypothetical protein
VAADLQQQFLSPEHASHAYGIVVNAEGGVDDSATLGQRIILRRERDQRQLRIDAIRSHSGAAIVAVPSAVATALRIAPHQVLYCASSVCGVYAEAEITDVKGIEVGRPVASALHVSVGDRIQITPMSSSWLPHSTAELRRQFSIHQLHADGRGRVGHH